MKIEILQTQSKARLRKASSGFTLVETIVATLVAATMLSAHYLAFAAGYALVTVTREDLSVPDHAATNGGRTIVRLQSARRYE